jgi:hypothetical protein
LKQKKHIFIHLILKIITMTRKLTFLKNALLGLLFVSLFSFNADAQWTTVGSAEFTAGGIGAKLVQVYNDTVYVAFADATNTSYLSVMKYDGTSWTLVGQAGFTGVSISTDFDFKISNAGELYIAHSDASGSGGVTVMKYANGAWANVGVANMSNGAATEPNLAFDSTSVPYVAYAYEENIPSSADMRVQKFNGTSWTIVGSAIGLTSNPGHIPSYPDIEFDGNGSLYVAYALGTVSRIQEFDGTSWSAVGNFSNFTSIDGINQQLVFDSNQKPYILFHSNDGLHSDRSRLITPTTFIGGTWEYLGGLSSVGTGGYVENVSVTIDDNDRFYVVQTELSPLDNTFGTAVYTYDGANWVLLGNSAFRTGLTSPTSSAMSNNILYIFFADAGGNGTVEQYDLNTSINQISTLNKEISIYPNPTKGQLTIEGVEGIESVRILTMDGKVMQTIATNSNTISVEALPQGIYTIEVMTTEGRGYKNFIKK